MFNGSPPVAERGNSNSLYKGNRQVGDPAQAPEQAAPAATVIYATSRYWAQFRLA